MGGEILVPIAWVCGVIAFVWLVVRTIRPISRPYALPTLVACMISASILIHEFPNPDYYWRSVSAHFLLAAVVFGAHAHAINWLVNRSTKKPRPNYPLELMRS